MSVADILDQLKQDDVRLELSLRGSNLNSRHHDLIQEHRAGIISQLALQHISGGGYYLKIETSGSVYVMAKPQHFKEAVEKHPWGVIWDSEGFVILTWGDVPPEALIGKLDLRTGQAIASKADPRPTRIIV